VAGVPAQNGREVIGRLREGSATAPGEFEQVQLESRGRGRWKRSNKSELSSQTTTKKSERKRVDSGVTINGTTSGALGLEQLAGITDLPPDDGGKGKNRIFRSRLLLPPAEVRPKNVFKENQQQEEEGIDRKRSRRGQLVQP